MRLAVGVGAPLLIATLSGCAPTTQGAGSPVAAAPAIAQVDAPSTPASQPQPCAGNTTAQFIRVSITAQHAWLCARDHLVYDTAVTTGMTGSKDTRTPTGSFRIQGRNTDTTLNPGAGEAFAVKYWVPFDAPAFGFHDSAWQKFPYGSARYRTQGSHGCVHMPLAAMKYLYDWVQIGASVHIAA